MTTITQPDHNGSASRSATSPRSTPSRARVRSDAPPTELGYTQSAVSQQIAALERIVGEKLVERPGGPRAVSLTEAGTLLLRHAEAIVARLDAARADMASLRAGETGTLRVGTYQCVGARVLPEVMRRFLAEWPGIELGLSEPTTDPELYTRDRARRRRPRVRQPPAPRRAVRGARADERPVRAARPRRHPARARADVGVARDLGELVLIGANPCASGIVVETGARERGYGRLRHSAPTTTARSRGSSRRDSGSPSPRSSRSHPATSASGRSGSSRRCHVAWSPSSGTATATAPRRRAPSSRSRAR